MALHCFPAVVQHKAELNCCNQ